MATTPRQPTDRKRKTTAPKKQAVTTAKGWKRGIAAHDLEVPSGNVARVRREPMQAFITKGIIPNSLLTIVQKAVDTGQEVDFKLDELTTEQILEMMSLLDAVIVECVEAPQVHPVPYWTDDNAVAGECAPEEVGKVIPLVQRNQDLLFVDEVDMEDKNFIFQWVVGGTADLAAFRSQQTAAMERVRSGQELGDNPE